MGGRAIEDKFINSTYFIVPVWIDNYSRFSGKLQKDEKWTPASVDTSYLLRYASQIAGRPDLFCQYSLQEPETLPVSSYRKAIIRSLKAKEERQEQVPVMEAFLENLKISEVLISCFATGVGFVEFKIEYGKLPIDCIIDFSYAIKNTRNKTEEGKKSLYQLTLDLLPEGESAQPFFYCSAPLKYECICYHMLKIDRSEAEPAHMAQLLYWLGRNYNTSFPYDSSNEQKDASHYDFRYSPYPNDNWTGSQEALANLNYEKGDASENMYLRTFKYEHLTRGYHFLYLMILNQRFAAMRYIEEIIETDYHKADELRELNHRITRLKTVFSLKVISNDMLYQNVYRRMYDIMDIDNLLEDLQDNEHQVELIQSEDAVRFEKLSQGFLAAISMLAVFSALIDASSYFELFKPFAGAAKWISLVLTLGVVFGVGIFMWIRWKRKK